MEKDFKTLYDFSKSHKLQPVSKTIDILLTIDKQLKSLTDFFNQYSLYKKQIELEEKKDKLRTKYRQELRTKEENRINELKSIAFIQGKNPEKDVQKDEIAKYESKINKYAKSWGKDTLTEDDKKNIYNMIKTDEEEAAINEYVDKILLEESKIESLIKTPKQQKIEIQGIVSQLVSQKKHQALIGRGVGLANCGNTCYMNSVIQMLYHIPGFRKYFDENIFTNPGYGKNLEAIFDEMIKCEKSSTCKSLTTNQISNYIKNMINLAFLGQTVDNQQDATEFLGPLLDRINPPGASYMTLDQLYTQRSDGTIREDTIRPAGNKSIKNYILIAPIPEDKQKYDKKNSKYYINMIDCINSFSTPEELPASYKLDIQDIKYGKDNESEKYMKRTVFDFDNTDYLFIAPKRTIRGTNPKTGEEESVKNQISIRDIDNIMITDYKGNKIGFQLIGVVIHIGDTPKSGHYVFNLEYPIKRTYNDSVVSLAGIQTHDSRDGYIFVYQKV